MRGSIRQRGKGSWQIQIYTGKDSEGKPRRHLETVKGRKGDAQRRLTELLASLDKGVYVPPGKLTVSDLLNQWLDGYVKTNCSIRTQDTIQSIADHHLTPALGHIPLKELQAPSIQAYYSQALEKPLSPRSVHYHHRLLKQALKYAVHQGYLGRNPCDLVYPPSPKGKPMRTLTQSEVTDLLIAASSSIHYPIIYAAVSTGLRQAELLGLRWRDIDTASRSISVNRVLYKRRGVCQFNEPKTPHSRRRVSMTSKLAEFLSEYRLERERLYHEIGRTITLDDLVFANYEGKPVDPGVLTHNFARIAKRAGLENVRFHDLRHTFASLMLLRGVPAKVISEALGHASVAFTLQVYSHILPGMHSEAMALLDEVLPAAINGAQDFNVNLTSTHAKPTPKP